jgi:CheY-like chemotaxis protein
MAPQGRLKAPAFRKLRMGRRILLVDDDVLVRTLTSRVLRSENYEVVEASDGLEAWSLAQETRFDLVITDSRMPNLSGSELVTRLRDLHPALPILQISGSHGSGSEEMMRGVASLFKPFGVGDLVTAVRGLLCWLLLHVPALTPEMRSVLD